MQPFHDQLNMLKQKLVNEEDFNVTFTYFFDHLSDDQRFIDSSKKVKHPFLKSVLKVVGKEIFNHEISITNFLLLQLPKTRFYHGSCFMHDRLAALFFFEDIDMGMACIHLSHEVRYTRFTGKLIKGDKLFLGPNEGKKTFH